MLNKNKINKRLCQLKNRSRLEIDLTGPDGNAFALLGRAKSLCAQLGIPFKPLSEKMTSGDYENLVKVFDDTFGNFVTLYR